MKTCENCKHWDGTNAVPAAAKLRTRYDTEDFELVQPPHGDLRWSQCRAALEGFSNHDVAEEAALFSSKMAVFDGSAYMAELWTRFDHVCGEWIAITSAETPSPHDIIRDGDRHYTKDFLA